MAWSTSPNPTHDRAEIRYAMPVDPPANWTVDVFDATGRRVKRLTTCDTGRQGILRWDGCDGRGSRVVPGVYFLKPTWPPDEPGTQIVVVR